MVFVQGSGAKRCWLINMQAELPSLRCWLLHKSAPHTYTQHKSAHTNTQMQLSPSDKLAVHRCIFRRTHAQCYESTGVQKYSPRTHTHICTRILTHTLTCSSLHLFSCVLFFPCSGFPRRVGGKRSPRGGTGALIDSREFGGRGASKTALLLSLSSRPSALSAPTTGSLSFANTSRKN